MATSATALAAPSDVLDSIYSKDNCPTVLTSTTTMVTGASRQGTPEQICPILQGLTPVAGSRTTRQTDDGQVAWFDESVSDADGNRSMASGLLVGGAGQWRLVHYHLSMEARASTTITGSSQTVIEAPVATPTEPEKRCRKSRHKTNKVANC